MKAPSLVFLGFLATLGHAQLSLPPRELGFVYKGNSNAAIKIAAYIDLTCPYSKLSFATLKTVSDSFSPAELQFRINIFSLPYHRNSHTISKAANLLSDYKSPKGAGVFDWIQAVYDRIDQLYTEATFNQSDAEVLSFLTSLAVNVTGIPATEFRNGVANTDIDIQTRLQWKYGVTRGVYGTPFFSVNDVFVNADSSWTVAQWSKLVNDLLGS